jgi:flagellar biosynthesis regulator FlbT
LLREVLPAGQTRQPARDLDFRVTLLRVDHHRYNQLAQRLGNQNSRMMAWRKKPPASL